ncbi:MAG: hypothetical protein IKW86_04710 [Salinivirgaceae bacterium]|nr:hypothetical protein [Salinivirgaceae bacterium]
MEDKTMGEYYQTTIEKKYVKVTVNIPLFIDTVKALIQDSLKKVRIEDENAFNSTDHISKNIYVYPDTDFRMCQDEDLQTLERSIQGVLNEINDEVLEMRELLITHRLKSLKVYDRIILKMVVGKHNQSLVNDMCNLLKILSDNFTNTQIISSIKQVEMPCESIAIHKDNAYEVITKLFNAIKTAIMVINNNSEAKR